jgi:hypothetical protein
MCRRISTLLTIFSLLALLATLVVWPLSYRRDVGHTWRTGTFLLEGKENVDSLFALFASRGIARAEQYVRREPATTNPADGARIEDDRLYLDQLHYHDDFERAVKQHDEGPSAFEAHRHQAQRHESRLQVMRVALPLWIFAIIFSALPLIRLRATLIRRARRARGLCVDCGYDLRESPGACPECGQITPQL